MPPKFGHSAYEATHTNGMRLRWSLVLFALLAELIGGFFVSLFFYSYRIIEIYTGTFAIGGVLILALIYGLTTGMATFALFKSSTLFNSYMVVAEIIFHMIGREDMVPRWWAPDNKLEGELQLTEEGIRKLKREKLTKTLSGPSWVFILTRGVGQIIGHLAGVLLGATLTWGMFNWISGVRDAPWYLGVPRASYPVTNGAVIAAELFAGFFTAWISFYAYAGVTRGRTTRGEASLMIGLASTVAGLFSIPISGGVGNMDLWFGASMVSQYFEGGWLFAVGGLGVIAQALFYIFVPKEHADEGYQGSSKKETKAQE